MLKNMFYIVPILVVSSHRVLYSALYNTDCLSSFKVIEEK